MAALTALPATARGESATPTPEEMESAAKRAADELARAYNRKDRAGFFKLLSDDFKGDQEGLENALRRDFSKYASLNLDLYIDKVDIKKDQVRCEIYYDLVAKDAGGVETRLREGAKAVFRLENGRARLYRLDGQTVFGRESEASLEDAARQTMNELVEYYMLKRYTAFMSLVSDDFQGRAALDDAILNDFRQYRSVNLNVTVDAVTARGGRIDMKFHYNMAIVDKQGNSSSFNGASECLFKWEEGRAKLYKMLGPILFGNSLPQSVRALNP